MKKEKVVDKDTLTFEELYAITHLALTGACESLTCESCVIKENCSQLRLYGKKEVDGCVAMHKTHAILVMEKFVTENKND